MFRTFDEYAHAINVLYGQLGTAVAQHAPGVPARDALRSLLRELGRVQNAGLECVHLAGFDAGVQHGYAAAVEGISPDAVIAPQPLGQTEAVDAADVDALHGRMLAQQQTLVSVLDDRGQAVKADVLAVVATIVETAHQLIAVESTQAYTAGAADASRLTPTHGSRTH